MFQRIFFTNILLNLLLILNFFGYCLSQSMWTKTYGGNEFDAGYSIHQTSDNGYIIGGLTQSYIWLIKTDSYGDTIWTKIYRGTNRNYSYECAALQTEDDGFIIAGPIEVGDGGLNIWLLKTDTFGDTIWTKSYGGNYDEYISSVQQTSDEGYIIAGCTFSFKENSHGDVYLIKTNSSGDTVWTKTYGENSFWEDIKSVQQTSDSGYIMTGCAYDIFIASDKSFFIKTDSLGDTVWTKTYGSKYLYSVQQTSDHNYIIAGTSYYPGRSYDALLIKSNSSGDTIWTKNHGGINTDYANFVQQTSDQGYIIAGETESFGAGGKDVWLIKTNSSGDTIWTKTYGGSGNDIAYSVVQTSDSGYIIAGETESFGAGDSDVWLIKTDQDGNTEGITFIDNSTNNIAPDDYKLYQNYPNPFNPITNISYTIKNSNYVILKIYNILAQEIQTLVNTFQKTGNYTVNFDAKNLSSGLYFYKLQVGDNVIQTKKMLLMR
jgi:hypothetical protein